MAQAIMASVGAATHATAGRVTPGAANAVYVVVPPLDPRGGRFGDPVRADEAAEALGEKPSGEGARYYLARTPTKAQAVADALGAAYRAPFVVEERPSRGGIVSTEPTARWRSVPVKNEAGLVLERKWIVDFHVPRDRAHAGCALCDDRERWNAERDAYAKARRDVRLRAQQWARAFAEEAATLAPHHDKLDQLFEDYAPVYSMLAQARVRCGFRELARAM